MTITIRTTLIIFVLKRFIIRSTNAFYALFFPPLFFKKKEKNRNPDNIDPHLFFVAYLLDYSSNRYINEKVMQKRHFVQLDRMYSTMFYFFCVARAYECVSHIYKKE